jgi:peroxiredoxin
VNASLVGIGAFGTLILTASGWLGWQVLGQNGRMLLRLEGMEKRLEELELGEREEAADNSGEHRADRFKKRSLARSQLKRDGLKAGTAAPDFRLPRLDGSGELALSDLRGRRVLLVFSSPGCGPCNMLAPELQNFHREHPQLEVVMVSKGEPKENRTKVKEHGLTFPIVLQQQWEISRRYAMFATPIAYLIDETGFVVHDVAVGTDAILDLMTRHQSSILADRTGEVTSV